jgi:hypothetical protein
VGVARRRDLDGPAARRPHTPAAPCTSSPAAIKFRWN